MNIPTPAKPAAPTAESVAASIPEAEAHFEQRRRMAALGVKVAAVAVPLLAAIIYFTLRFKR